MVKPRAYGQGFSRNEQRAAWYTLHTVLKTILLLLAAIMPFMPEHIWRQLYSKRSIHSERLPKPAWPKTHRRYTQEIFAFNREVWKVKKERNLALRDPIEIEVPKALLPFKEDLVKMHALVPKS